MIKIPKNVDKNKENKEKFERKSENYSANRNITVDDDNDDDDDFTVPYTKRGTQKYKKEYEPLNLGSSRRSSSRKLKKQSECIDLISDSDDEVEFELSDHDSYSHPPPPQNPIVISQKQFIESLRGHMSTNLPRIYQKHLADISNTMASGNETSQITHYERLLLGTLTSPQPHWDGSCTNKDLRCLRGFTTEFYHPNLLEECSKIREGYKQANPGKESPFNLKEITSWYRSSV